MLKELYEAIRKDAAPVQFKVNGREYTDKQLYPVKTPEPQPLVVSTLTSLADYLNTNVDCLPDPPPIKYTIEKFKFLA